MLGYIYDFLSILFDKLKDKKKIRAIILFGSFARGNPRKDSDIDLFIDIEEKNKLEIEELVRESLNEFELKLEKTWKLKGAINSIIPVIGDIEIEKWKELRSDIGSYGKVLYGEYYRKKGEKQRIIISYDISKLKQKDKMHVIRRLFGYRLKRGKKIYEQEGILEEFRAEKFPNAIIVDREHYRKLVDVLRERKVLVKVMEIWTS